MVCRLDDEAFLAKRQILPAPKFAFQPVLKFCSGEAQYAAPFGFFV